MATTELTNENFSDTIKNNDFVVIDFWAEWCGPCKRFSPVFNKVSGEYEDVVFGTLDTDANQDIAGALGIMSIPTVMAFNRGNLVFNQPGLLNSSQLKQVVDGVREMPAEAADAAEGNATK